MTDAVPQSTTAPLSEGQRIVDTFVAPSKTFTDLLRKSAWWGPLVILLIVSALFSFAVEQKVGWDKVFENNIHQSPKQEEQLSQLPPDQLASRKAISVKITKIVSYVYWIFVLVFTAIIAVLVWATVNFGFGGTASYGQVFAVYMYANLVMNIKYILATIALFVGLAPDSFLQQNPVGTNMAYFFPDWPKWLIALTMHIDIFEIWSVILCVIGIAIVAKVKRGTAAVAVVGWWFLIILIFTGLAAAQS